MLRMSLFFVIILFVSIRVLLFDSKVNAQPPLTLEEAVTLALDANDPSVVLLEQKALAFEDRAIAESQIPDPILSAQIANLPLSSFDYNHEPMTQFKLGIRQKLPKGRTLSLTHEKRNIQAEGLRFEKQLKQRQIVLNVRQIWLELYYWREARKLISESQKKVNELGGVAKAVYANGRSSLQDVLRVELEVAALDAKFIDIDRNEGIARSNLERFLGQKNGARELSTGFPVLLQVRNDRNIDKKLAIHPSLQMLDARVNTKKYDVDIAAEQYKPGFSFDVQYGFRDSRSDLGSVGVLVSFPIFSKKNKDYALSAEKRLWLSQRLERDTQVLELKRSFQHEWAQYTRLGERIDVYKNDVLLRAKETSEAAMTAYENKLADFSELVRAELAVLDIELTLIRLQIDYMLAQANLLFLIGE